MLNPDRSTGHFRNALSGLVNDPDPPVAVVQGYCPNRSNGNRYVYYLGDGGGERDPDDAKWVKLRDRKLEPVTREPFVDGEEPIQEVSI